MHDNELKMSGRLIENRPLTLIQVRFEDEYRQALWEKIEAKLAGRNYVFILLPSAGRKVVDLMDALKASVQIPKPKNTKRLQRRQ